LKAIFLASLCSLLAFAIVAQEPTAAAGAPSAYPELGTWKGQWESSGRSRANGQMEIEITAIDGDRVTGQVRVATSATPACSPIWEKLAGIKKGEKLYAQYDVRGRCGKADVILWIDPAEKTVIVGTYSSEYPDKGKIRLTRQQN